MSKDTITNNMIYLYGYNTVDHNDLALMHSNT
jgi:hypothetical protein